MSRTATLDRLARKARLMADERLAGVITRDELATIAAEIDSEARRYGISWDAIDDAASQLPTSECAR